MFRFLSPKKSNTGSANNCNEASRHTRGKSGVVVWQPTPGGTFGSPKHGHNRGRSLGVQDISGIHPSVLGLSSLTDEPCSLAVADVGNIRRGRQAPAEAAASLMPSRVQALASQRSELMETEKPKPNEVLQPRLVAKGKLGEDVITQAVLHGHEGAPKEPPRVYARRRFRGNRSHRFPLQTGTDPPCLSNLANEERLQHSRTSTAYELPVELPQPSKIPLQATLFNGPRDLFSAPPTPPTTSALHILAVGVAYGDLQDPHHDISILSTLFKGHQSEKTKFKGISGDGVTPKMIEDAIGELYRETLKSSGSNLLILLTGEGDNENKMYLMDDMFITDKDLRRWMWKLQIDCYPNNRTVTVILDYCRKHPRIPFGKSHFGIEFIGTCSPGQTAAALRFPNTQHVNLPRSCFLLSLMMSSYRFVRAKSDLIGTVDHELQRLMRLLELTHKKKHETGECGPCNRKEECPIPYRPQSPDWHQAGGMKSVYEFIDRLSTTNLVPKVYERVIGYRYFREANGLPVEGVTFYPTPPHQATLDRHNRGSSKPVHAAPNIQLDFQRLLDSGAFDGREQLLLQ
ncbi:unnamed protein product [Rhizoctonia solani]|uniref:Uncharacterized protein n=1 Tax=Rhizoctonia solani TaxID=456999 RepID=A0A8H2W713_9AGAM|nr:unnamed protein product [Rhizoctonia solani]